MRSTRHPRTPPGAPLALLLGAVLSGSAVLAQDTGPSQTPASAPAQAPAAFREEEVTRCGDKQVGTGEGMLRPLGHGFYADGNRVRRGCTLILQRLLRNRPPVPFTPDSFEPLGCGFVRAASSIYWALPLASEDSSREPNGQPAEVLTRLDLADAQTFEVDADCRPRDARFFYLNHASRPEYPAFVAVPRGDGQGYEELGCGFVRFEGHVYFGARSVDGVHAPSFSAVLGRIPYFECGGAMYGKDRAKVWWQHLLVRGAKARSFRVPKEEDNPGLVVACDGKRSFQREAVDKKPNPLCKPARKPVVRKRK
jgi:hypothetical protein